MSGYSCTILADSENPAGERVTTVQIRLPLVVWAEFLTHRTFSRNARSNRAVPSRVLIREVLTNPFVPDFWGSNKSGMVAGEELTGVRRWLARKAWLWARYPAIAAAWTMSKAGLHKQDANRVLNPWQWIDAVVTGDEGAWQAFFALRCHQAADPKIHIIAQMIRQAIEDSTPVKLPWGQWHTPYYPGAMWHTPYYPGAIWGAYAYASAGACARVSYRSFDGTHDVQANEKLAKRLIDEKPAHASPLEHVLQASKIDNTQPGPVGGKWRSLRQIEGV